MTFYVWLAIFGPLVLGAAILFFLHTNRKVNNYPSIVDNGLCVKFQDTLRSYQNLPESYQHGDLLPVLLAIQSTSGGKEAVRKHFSRDAYGAPSAHYDQCDRNSFYNVKCTFVPKWAAIQNTIQQAKDEIEAAKQAELEFVNRPAIETADFILDGMKSEIKTSQEQRTELKNIV